MNDNPPASFKASASTSVAVLELWKCIYISAAGVNPRVWYPETSIFCAVPPETSASVNITFADGVVGAVYMVQGTLYPISATASSASVLYLY